MLDYQAAKNILVDEFRRQMAQSQAPPQAMPMGGTGGAQSPFMRLSPPNVPQNLITGAGLPTIAPNPFGTQAQNPFANLGIQPGGGAQGQAGGGAGQGMGFGAGDRTGRDLLADIMGLFGGSPEFTGAPPGQFGIDTGFPQGSANAAEGRLGIGGFDPQGMAMSADRALGWGDVRSPNSQSPMSGVGFGGGGVGGWGNGLPSFSVDPRTGEVSININPDAPNVAL